MVIVSFTVGNNVPKITFYDELHIGGYYRGILHRVDTVKAALKGAAEFIKKL